MQSHMSVPNLRFARIPVLTVAANVLIRPLLPEDVSEKYVRGMNDARVNRFLVSAKAGPYTFENIGEMVRVNFEASDAILFGIFLSDVHCGNVRLHDINPQSAYLGIAVFQFDSQRQGLGSKAIRAISEHALSDLRIRN